MNVNELRKRMLVMECDTHRLELTESWRDLSAEIGFGSSKNQSRAENVRRWGHWLAPVGAFLLTRWFRSKSKDSHDHSLSSTHWGFLGQFFDWMAKFSPQNKR